MKHNQYVTAHKWSSCPPPDLIRGSTRVSTRCDHFNILNSHGNFQFPLCWHHVDTRVKPGHDVDLVPYLTTPEPRMSHFQFPLCWRHVDTRVKPGHDVDLVPYLTTPESSMSHPANKPFFRGALLGSTRAGHSDETILASRLIIRDAPPPGSRTNRDGNRAYLGFLLACYPDPDIGTTILTSMRYLRLERIAQ